MRDAKVLHQILDGVKDATNLSLALLQDITDNFSQERKIGHGGFAEVYKGVLGERIVAVKRIRINENTFDDKLFRREFASLSNTNHRNVVRFLGFCSNTYEKTIQDDRSGETILANVLERLLCLEYVSNGSLDKHIKDELRGLEWETRYEIIIGICRGLRYLHEEKKITHMDLKPANILLHHKDGKYMVPKITDFGLSRLNGKSLTVGKCYGTGGYMAPEYNEHGETTPTCDIYSLGAIIRELVTGCMEARHQDNVLRRWRHRWNKPPTQLQYQQVTRCVYIAERCREQKPEARPSISEIITFLSKSESTHGQINPLLNEDDMLGIKPLELRLPSDLNKGITRSIELTNGTRKRIAFSIQLPNPEWHDHADKFIVKSMKVSESIGEEEIAEHMSGAEACNVVDEVDLMVVYEPKKPLENTRSRDDTHMPTEEIHEAKKRKTGESSSGKGKNKLDSSANAEADAMDVRSSVRGQYTNQLDRLHFHPPENFSRSQATNMTYLVRDSDRAIDVTRGAMGSLLHKLGVLHTEFNLETSVKKDAEELVNMQQVLRNVSRVKQDNLDDRVKLWSSNVREMSYDLEDFVDGFLVHSEPAADSTGLRELTHEMYLEKGESHQPIGDLIKHHINKKVQDAAKKCKEYKADRIVAVATTKADIEDLRISGIYIDTEKLVGIEMPRDELIRLLEEGGDVSKKDLRIVSIVGLGGLGKTTLAKVVYDKLKGQHDLKAFVSVGQNPDVKKVLKTIIGKFAAGFNAENIGELIEKLQELLEDKRYFIVIDDLWESCDWEIIKSAFPDKKCGSRIITTTRNQDVALACCNPRYVYMIKQLSEEDSKNLFFTRTRRLETDCPDRLKYISVQILKTCRGIPLAINSIASLLANKDGRTWEYVWDSLGAMAEGNNGLENVKKILDLSYIHLPDYLKTCLLYVCKYQEDREIEKNDILRQWVAEGFVHVSTDSKLDAEDVAEHYFQQLVTICMIQPEKIDYYNNEVLSCRVHDIILDLLRSKSTKVNFIHVIDGPKENVRNLETMSKRALTHVRSALIQQGSLVPYFLLFKYIRVLHLEDKRYWGDWTPRSLTGISQLLLLRYLKFVGDKFELPNKIGEMQQLETIDLDGELVIYGKRENYPSDIVTLPRLSYLRYARGIVLPDGIGRLKSLRTLEGVCLFESTLDNIKGLGELTNLRILQFSSRADYKICFSKDTHPIMDALHSSISKISTSLKILNLGERWHALLNIQSWSRTLFPPGSWIRELNLCMGCNLERCPEWIGQLPDLYSLSIRVGEVADGLSIAERLPSLAYLKLKVDKPDGEEKEESVVISGFKALKHLILCCKKVKLTFGAKALPKLEKLDLMFCYHMTPQLLPDGIEQLPAGTLKEILLRVDYNDEMPADYSWAGTYEHFEDLKQHKIVARPLLEMAFERHHPDADIFVVFEDIAQEYEDSLASEESGSQTSEEFEAATRQLVDDEGVEEEEHYYYGEEADEGAYQVYGSQTATQIQDNTRQSVEFLEMREESGRMSINTDAPLTVDTSLHLVVGSEGRQSGRTQDSAVWESSQLPCTRLLAPSPSYLDLTLAPCSSPDRAEPLANFPVNAVGHLLDLNQAPSAGLPDLNQAPLDEATNTNSSS